jgi:hypothetical protein
VRQVALIAVFLVHGAIPVGAEPLDLQDALPRPVQVVFEVSPPEAPGNLDARYGLAAQAWFAPGPDPGQATIRISSLEMERILSHHQPVPGSFSDFVWVFDVSNGHVLSARVTGQFVKRVDWGLFSTDVVTYTDTRLGTRSRAGFRPPRHRLGHLVFEFCIEERDCTEVPPRPLDPFTGYVNAVGSIAAHALAGPRTTSFSPLGEAVWSEVDTTAVSLGPTD